MMAENNLEMLKIQQCVVANKLPRNRPYICNICFKHFETPSKLARHYLIHTGQKPFECDVCHKTFRQLVHLERHQLTHNLPFKCSICQRHFKNMKTFVKHQQLHNETYQNDVKQVRRLLEAKQQKPMYGVYNTFTTEERWAFHPHSKSDPTKRRKNIHACTICGKMFPSQSKLDRHVLIHTGQRPFKCVLCSKSFRQSTHLKIHQLTHSEEKPFQCCFCQKGFKIQSKLLKHKQLHTRSKALSLKVKSSRSCPLPNKLNANQHGFENGVMGESEENNPLDVHSVYVVPFQCPECEECFESEQILNEHKCFPARGGKIPSRLKRSYNYKIIVKKILAKLRRARSRKLGNFRSEKKVFKNSFLKNCDFISGEQNSEQTQRTFMGSLGKHGAYKTVGNKKKKTLTLPFSWQKQFQSQNMGKNLKGILTTENMLTMDNSVSNKDLSIYGSSGEEFFNNREALQCGFSDPSENIHTGHKMFPCDKCEKVFPSVSKLQRHYLIHTGQRPFGCHLCGKSFRQAAHLKRHEQTHIEKSPYGSLFQLEYDNFNKLFSHPGDNVNCNTSQQSQASGFQKYETSESDQMSEVKADSGDFILGTPCSNRQPCLSNALLESEQSHHFCNYSGRQERNDGLLYQCSVCSKSFRSPSKLERHYLIHAGQKPFECSVCGKRFRQAPHWKRHQLTHFKERRQ
ncbi:zinc finger protein 770 [Carlito syrichta]|uniref:Zinc finger protein 770 n=1 Tax=Carlito syrichta TaxID=1868482 RepID=A0A1U7TVQ8_CARSF|nr:zinc finger protein 770 [Carlito syrichta]XP_008064084.1 zinc finger protein 770 [Carlito syrichta]XP_008064086.1 zinc finger protein 770 [Carlito syrichta]XP_021572124.1 zinc finger protein 770 [Carlito syrichta]XP_021572125.1 zinc finger protein 770 [Carlito syrichta]XP_021572126.1 zinc finger protein 770 [Carlito syrichta]